VERFGGLTAYARSPAEGVWAPTATMETEDDIFVVEVMVDEFMPLWWRELQHGLEEKLHQQHVVIRAIAIQQI
jgi:hypothetical protein